MAGKYWWEDDENKSDKQATTQSNTQTEKKYWWEKDSQQSSGKSFWWDTDGSTITAIGNDITNRVNSWLENHNNYITNYQNRYSGRKYTYEDSYVSDSASWLDTVSKQKSNFDAEADSILSYMDQYKDYLDTDWMKSVRETLTSARGTQSQILQNSTTDNEWWNSFNNEELVKQYGSAEDAYKYYQRSDGYSNKYSGMTAEEIQKALETLEDGEEKDWLNYNQYDFYKNDSAYISQATSGWKSYEAQKTAQQQKEGSKSFWEKVAENYAYAPADTSLPAAAIANAQAAYRNDTSYREPNDEWSTEQKNHFGYLFFEDPSKAYTYAEQVNNQIKAEAQYEQQQAVGEWSSQNPGTGILGTLGAVATAPLGMADFLDNIIEYSTRGTITQKGALSPFDFGQAAQSGIANKLNGVDENGVAQNVLSDDWGIFGGKGWGDIYSLGVSTANSMLSAIALGGTGTLVNFIGQGGAAGVDDALSRGATAEQALLYGTIVGAAEGLTEFIPAENLIKVGSSATIKNYLKQVLKQGVGEFIEEGSSSIIGSVADYFIMQDKSNFNALVKEYMDSGMEEDDAKSKAIGKLFGDAVYDAIGGFVSGSVSAGFRGGYRTVVDAIKGNQDNIDAVKKYGGKTDALIQEGLQNDKKSDSYKLATKYQQQVQGKDGKTGKAMTGFQIRNLLAANQEQVTKADLEKIQNAAANRLAKVGQREDIYKIAELATKYATGQEMTRAERSTLARSSYGSQVASELLDGIHPDKLLSKWENDMSEESGAEYSTDWTGEIGTESNQFLRYNNEKLVRTFLEAMAEDTATYKSLEERVGTENKLSVSESGQATIRESGEAIDLSKVEVADFITDKETGKITDMTLKVDGKEVKASEIDYADDSQSYLFSAVRNIENITPGDATVVIRDYDPSSGQTVGEYLNGVDEAYTYGYHRYSEADMAAGLFTPKLTDVQAKSAYLLGQTTRENSDTDADAPVVKMRTAEEAKLTAEQKTAKQKAQIESDDVEVYFEDGGTVVKFDEHTGKYDDKRMAAVNTAKFLSKLGIGGKYYFFESYVNADGVRVYKDANGDEVEAPNGTYKDADGSIHIDLNAGDYGQGTALFTLGHELAHFVKAQSKKQFKILCDLVKEAFDKTDISMHERVLAKQKFLSDKRGKPVGYTEAYEEVVADAMSTMITDGSFHEKLMEIKVKDKDLFNTIKRFFKKMIAKFREAYKELTPDQQDAQDIRAMKDMFDKIQTAFVEGLVEASDNFQAAMESVVEENAKPVSSNEIVTDGAVVTDGNGERHSIRSMKHDIAEGKMFEDLKNVCGWTQTQVNTLKNQLTALVEYMIPYRNILDMNETYGMEGRRFSPYKPNSDPLYKISMDFSTLCSKRLLTQYVIEQLQLRENRPMSAEEQMAIRDMLNEYRKVEKGLQVACAMCYVEAARLKSPKQMQRWLDDPAPLLKDYFGKKNKAFNDSVKEAQADFKESKGYDREAPKKDMKPADVKELNKIGPKMRSQYQMSAEEFAIVERAKSLPNSTYLTAGNLANLSETDPVIYDAYTAFVRTATRSKSLETDEPYYYGDSTRDNGNGIIVSDSFIEAVNKENGMRFSSWSDWRIQHLLDYITAVIDNSVRGAAMHGYTKFGDEVRVLGKTGMMFNMSGVAGTQTGLNEDGSLNFSPTESIDVNEAIQLREEFPEHAGLQCIGVSDEHIVALLRSDIIDYIIPYHISGLNKALRTMADIYGWADYTDTQHAAIDKSIKLENAVDKEHWHEEPVFSEFFVGYDTGMTGIEAMRASAEKYKQMCKDRGMRPKFEQFANEDNYWKLLIDRKMINQQTGNLIQQKAVTPTFDFDVIKSVVDKYVENYDAGLEARALNHIVENWDSIPQRIKDLKKQGGTKAKKTKKAAATLANQTVAAQPADGGVKHSDRSPKWKPNLDSTEWDIVKYAIDNNQGTAITSTCNMFFKKSKGRTVFGIYSTDDSTLLYASSEQNAEEERVFVSLLMEEYRNGKVTDTSAKGLRAWAKAVWMQRTANDYHGARDVAPGRSAGDVGLHGGASRLYSSAALRNVLANIFQEGTAGRTGDGRVRKSDRDGNIVSDRDSTGKQLTQEQQEFFAGSKVRDKDGNLLVMYHGSSSDSKFTVFERRPLVNGKNYGEGYYFTEVKNEALKWGGNIYKVYVDLKNPYYVSSDGEVPAAIVAAAKERYGKSYDRLSQDPNWWGSKLTREEYINQNSRMWRNPEIALISAIDETGIPEGSEASYFEEVARRKTELLSSLGYDGVIVASKRINQSFQEVVAFDSEQIKLTTNKKPTADKDIRYSDRVTDKKTLAFLNGQIKRGEYIITYKSMRLDGDKLHSPMAAEINGKFENDYELGQWYQAVEHPELIKFDKKNGLPYFELDKGVDEFGDDLGKVPARYNPYEHSSNYVINDQFKTAFKRSNLVVVEMRIPLSEITSGYQAQYAKDPVGWQEWKKGDVATALAKKGKERKVLLSRWAMPYRILSDEEVAQQYKELLSGTDVKVPNNVVTPSLLKALEEAGVAIDYEGINRFNEQYKKKAAERAAKKSAKAKMSERGEGTSNRHLLANAFESITKSSPEYEMIQEYKGHIKDLNALEQELSKLNAEIRKIRFGTTGPRDTARLTEIEGKAKEVAKEINKYDKRLLSLEASEPLRKVIERERKKEAQKTKDHVKEIQQNKKVRAEQTELRHKIRKAIRDLDKILNRGNKQRNVKEDMKGFVSKALELADYLFTDHISNDDLIRRGITVSMRGNEPQLVKETEEILSKLYDQADSLTDEEFTRLDAKRKANMEKLRELLKAQRNEMLNVPVYNLFNDLVTEYASLKNSKQDSVKAAYDEVLENSLRAFMGDEDRVKILKNMRVADMTTEELNWLYRAYTMVLTNVRNANKFHVQGMTQTIEQVVGQIAGDFGSRKIPEKKLAIAAQKLANKIGWDYEKLYYALDRIGSDAFTKLIMNLANSENTVMQDIIEAMVFRDQIVKKYGFNEWAVNKEIDREFMDNSGKKFKMTLGQMMSLYAYSRREGAWDHIEYGGFVFGEAALTNPRPADSYKLSKAQCEAITNLLTKEQKGYVEDMQKYLSEVMGAKGNEVSMQLYGIKMFGEKNYFPIHIAGQFKAQANESQAKAAAGFQSMSNAGFTHAQNPNAKAPFVLEGFNEIWADHVNEMSRYHGTVPALEDIRRVMNRSTYSDSVAESQSIKQLMENHYGKEAVDYFDNLYREANSGAITDKLQKKSKKLLSLFRKNSVAYSLSVLIQQPASLVRAYALIDKKYFGFKGFGTITSGVAKAVSSKWNPAYANAYNEMLKYAPGVTMAKEIGGFDTATGGSIRSTLLDTGKSLKQKWNTGTALEKGKAVLDVVDDNAIANLPNVADKIAWIEIWNACKRETVATHKDLAANSEEFMQAVGERFTEVIRATQVYDSIFAKSPMLKSKNLAVQYLVSFMNEPNTVANMVENAVRSATRGDWKQGARTAGVVVYSIIFTNVLKSIVYAMRDDDEDETYIEKYIEAITDGMMSDINALNYIPLVRDAWSVAQGYDVERADMAIVADAVDALSAVFKNAAKNTEDMTEEELAEFDKKVAEANWKLVESLASFFGIPVKNIRREIVGVIDHAKIASANAGQTTAQSVWDTISDAVIDSIPFMQTRTKQDKLYNAIVSGDKAYLSRLKSSYKIDSAYQSAVVKALRENDPRIHQAAQAGVNGNSEERNRIYREIKAELGAEYANQIIEAINNEVNDIRNEGEPDKVDGQYEAYDFVEAVSTDDAEIAKTVRDDIIDTYKANGKTQEDAEKAFVSDVKSAIKEAYSYGDLSKEAAENMLMEYADMDEEEAASKVSYWSFCEEYPEYEDVFTEAHVEKYHEFAEPADISVEVYAQFITGTKGLANIKDEWGDVEVSEQDQVIAVIDSLPLTRQQKNALFLAYGYKESSLWKVSW